jgi:predicted ATPase/DNA-binding SARP family transcriptional activator
MTSVPDHGGDADGVRVAVLGPLELRDPAGRSVTVGPRLRTLLARLALDPGRVVAADELVEAVWDEQPPADPANALQSLVSRLRRAAPALVESRPAGYLLAVPADQVDAARFEVIAADGRQRAAGDPHAGAERLREALGLWRGPALVDVDSRFAVAAAARLEELRLAALEERIAADLAVAASGSARVPPALVAELDELVGRCPLRERLHGLRMRALAMSGRQAEALVAYEAIRARLADELGIDPSAQLQAEHLAVLRGVPEPPEPTVPPEPIVPAEPPGAGVPSPRPPEATRTNLRAQISGFVGRDEDLARLAGVWSGARLVTLTGPGGAGKTRLAIEAAAREAPHSPDGVWLIELAPVADPADLAQAALSALGAREAGLISQREPPTASRAAAMSPRERLTEALAGKQALLVLDNCEHLVAAVADLAAELLARCPQLRILATSREPLGVTGEVLHPVVPLPLPGPGADADQALRSPAVQLFAQRAAAVRPDFTVDSSTAPALLSGVVRICRALDGVPLAIELAAARLRGMTVPQVADRLDDRFRLLELGSRSAPPRHQTLRAVVDWSWDLLEEPERVLLQRLSVFSGGATAEAVGQVCGGDDVATDSVYLLAALVDKSLVVANPQVDGQVRYTMLDTVRAYAAERLDEAGETAALRGQHAGWLLDLVERAEPLLRTGAQLRAMELLSAERENINTALRWAVDGGHADVGVRLVGALGWYWFLRSMRAESAHWSELVLDLPDEGPPEVRARVLAVSALSAASGGVDLEGAQQRLVRAVKLVEALPPEAAANLHPALAMLPAMSRLFLGDDAGAREALEPLAQQPDPWLRSGAVMIRAAVMINLGEAGEARAGFESALAGFRAVGDRWGMGNALLPLSELMAYDGEAAAAIEALDEAREAFTGLGDREDLAQMLARQAAIRMLTGDVAGGQRDIEAAAEIARDVGAPDQLVMVASARAELARWNGQLAEAREHVAVAQRLLEAHAMLAFHQVRGVLFGTIAYVEIADGNHATARTLAGQALAEALASGDGPVMARIVELLARLTLDDGDPERAAELLGTAHRLRGGPDLINRDGLAVAAEAEKALGEPAFAEARRRGVDRSRADAVADLTAVAADLAEP